MDYSHITEKRDVSAAAVLANPWVLFLLAAGLVGLVVGPPSEDYDPARDCPGDEYPYPCREPHEGAAVWVSGGP